MVASGCCGWGEKLEVRGLLGSGRRLQWAVKRSLSLMVAVAGAFETDLVRLSVGPGSAGKAARCGVGVGSKRRGRREDRGGWIMCSRLLVYELCSL
ncbi:uncharacterized protein A4U43_C01F13300 [Asparagus officinalis]|uniref:Uncharacterized protein n=1 Tax=Asparagus officinalis TaxID=4686 RepID=A0A5P1FQP8_ASPOF|nr:uncharacterized protein A4U43_C01F13300 [Asparagus officinalis]